MGKGFDDFMLGLGRSLRRWLHDGDSAKSHGGAGFRQAARSRPTVSGSNIARPAAAQGRDLVQVTDDGRFRSGGYLFNSYDQALHYAQRLQRAVNSDATTPMPTPSAPVPKPLLWPAPTEDVIERSSRFTEVERELMARYGITPTDEGSFRARGYVFKSLDQALHWAARPGGGAAGGERLMNAARPSPSSVAAGGVGNTHRIGLVASVRSLLSEHSTANPRRQAAWLREPTTITVGDITLTTDLVYFGQSERHAYPTNNSLIDPNLRVASFGDPYGATLSYWPHYAEIDPRARRTYVEWLAAGRTDPNIPIGYVFIFFYGLERRLVHDKAHDEAARIVAEVRRLLGIYGQNGSFRGYATRFLDLARLLQGDGYENLIPSLDLRGGWEMPLGVRVYLGRKVAAGEALLADDALVWILAAPNSYLRTPAVRCFEELRGLWSHRFKAKYPDGVKVRPPKARIQHHYRAASGTFNANLSIEDLPDISTIAGPTTRFMELLEGCTQELEAFSRLLGREPDARETLAAATLLPRELRDGAAGTALRNCQARISELVGAGQPAHLNEVLRLLDLEVPERDGKVPVATTRQMGALLDVLDVGYEPDRRYGATSTLSGLSKVVLFESAGGGRVDPERPEYGAARTMAEIAALAAVSDGLVVPVELESICADLRSVPALDSVDRIRLAAHAEALLDDPPKRKDALKRLLALPEARRRRITQSAVSAILADGRVLPAEVRFLEGLHTALGLPQEEVYSALHRTTIGDDEPVIVASESRVPGIALPSDADGNLVEIDVSRLERIRKETSAVSELLAGIFVEEEESSPQRSAAVAANSRFDGLDGPHSELLWSILHAPLSSEAFESHAKQLRLLSAGALETINEWGFEVFDEAILAEDGMIYVQEHLIVELQTRGATL